MSEHIANDIHPNLVSALGRYLDGDDLAELLQRIDYALGRQLPFNDYFISGRVRIGVCVGPDTWGLWGAFPTK